MAVKRRLTIEDAEDMDLDGLSPEELNALQLEAEKLYQQILNAEPEDEDSDEYAEWEDRLEILDDLMDDIQDRL